ncbi:hypothetical protein ACC725_39260 [Rhizobium ruizarguesonis]
MMAEEANSAFHAIANACGAQESGGLHTRPGAFHGYHKGDLP